MASTVVEDPLGEYRGELFSHCYRMLGSFHDAEDVLQEVSLRALRGMADFKGRSSLRTWLHRIVVNTCRNELERKERRILPMDHMAAFDGDASIGEPVTEVAWLEPAPNDPHSSVEARESVELAFVAAVQHLPANQRAALVLFEAFAFSAQEIAEIMATTPASVNSALQRAREALVARRPAASQQATLAQLGDEAQRELVRRYAVAMQAHDLEEILSLVTEDATWSMPPLANWYRGHDAIAGFLGVGPFTREWRHVPTAANGQLAVGCYLPGMTGEFEAYCLDVLDVAPDGRIAAITAFLDPGLMPEFGLPKIFRG